MASVFLFLCTKNVLVPVPKDLATGTFRRAKTIVKSSVLTAGQNGAYHSRLLCRICFYGFFNGLGWCVSTE